MEKLNQDQIIIKDQEIYDLMSRANIDKSRVREIIAKAIELKGLTTTEMLILAKTEDPELIEEIFTAARKIKEDIYGNRLVLFSPLYISNMCANECLYCAFRVNNKELKRNSLNQEQIREEIVNLVDQGHKRILLVTGEAYPGGKLQYVFDSIETIYKTKTTKGEIRRVNVNIAPLTTEEFRELKNYKIGTYQLFQETYHRDTYSKLHIAGKKKDYDWRLTALDRAMEVKIDDVGIGVLFGLYDWKFELIALKNHITHLENKFGIGPHTISVPRLEPASGSDVSKHPPYNVSDTDFKKIVSILRLAVPYTGIILSTRESTEMRNEAIALGISQISAGSRTSPGGYTHESEDSGQFSLGDHRSLAEVIRDIMKMGYIPSFCTGCYRLGRTGSDFMDLAKPGLIKLHCQPNAMLTLKEYLEDFADQETKKIGERLIEKEMALIPDENRREQTIKNLHKIIEGERDLYF